ncbi:GGDEF domain-containing protein [Quadrisphaera sp. INWT6]|uniref:GGDEF domain-containing protein n=1 Tax=Quadrisphaera sp. INWT6 TaxID=2596917 RepID=UPI0018925C04|nr:GGDEF domain-containing protein [Quadrisphaera sp. INWT6]
MLTARQRSALCSLNAAARTDALTQLDNRRALHDHLTSVAAGTVVVVCDLDHFKVVNDTRGHLYGDQVLADFAAVLSEALRPDDHAARYGGEEFVLLLHADERAVPAVLARLRQRWGLAYPAITFSSGWAIHTESRQAHTTVGAADRALYEAKTSGRNRDIREADTARVSHPPHSAAQASAPPGGPLHPNRADRTTPSVMTTGRTPTPTAGAITAAGHHRPTPVLEDISS